jgi:hypothetical protein
MLTILSMVFVSAFLFLSDWVLCKLQKLPFRDQWKFENSVLPLMVIVQARGRHMWLCKNGLKFTNILLQEALCVKWIRRNTLRSKQLVLLKWIVLSVILSVSYRLATIWSLARAIQTRQLFVLYCSSVLLSMLITINYEQTPDTLQDLVDAGKPMLLPYPTGSYMSLYLFCVTFNIWMCCWPVLNNTNVVILNHA